MYPTLADQIVVDLAELRVEAPSCVWGNAPQFVQDSSGRVQGYGSRETG